jgi:hypothetical protein
MTYIGQYAPETRAQTCQYCGAAVEVGAQYAACEPCDTRNIFSDLYKDENGVRPRGWTLAEARAYLRARQVAS